MLGNFFVEATRFLQLGIKVIIFLQFAPVSVLHPMLSSAKNTKFGILWKRCREGRPDNSVD